MTNSLSLFCIIAATVLWVIAGVLYHNVQNRNDKIGGHISMPKSMWLSFALYIYYIFPLCFILVYLPDQPWKNLLLLVLVLFGIRFIVQSLMMYVFKNWRTKHGVAFNVVTAIVLGVSLVSVIAEGDFLGLNPKASLAWVYSGYFVIVLFALLTDSYYAVEFNKLVGKKTMGDEAVWFASTDPKYDRINAITKRNNYIFISAIVLVLCLYIMYYDQF